MSDIKDQFVTYEIAKRLKDLGFDDKCLAEYAVGDKSLHLSEHRDGVIFKRSMSIERYPAYIPAPLCQQAIDWLDTQHKIRVDLRHSQANGSQGFTIWRITEPNSIGKWDRIGFPIAFTDRLERNKRALNEALDLINP